MTYDDPPSFLDRPWGGRFDGIAATIAVLGIVYCAIVLIMMATTHRAAANGAAFVPVFPLIFPVWAWALLTVLSRFQSFTPRFPWLRQRKLMATPLRPCGRNGIVNAPPYAFVLALLVVGTLSVLCHSGTNTTPPGQPGSDAASQRYWFDNHGQLIYTSRAVWESGAIAWERGFFQIIVVFLATGLIVCVDELYRRRAVRKHGGALRLRSPWFRS